MTRCVFASHSTAHASRAAPDHSSGPEHCKCYISDIARLGELVALIGVINLALEVAFGAGPSAMNGFNLDS